MRSTPIGVLGAVVVLILILVAVFAPFLAPFDPTDQGAKRLLPPSREHWMGTDDLGRDIYSRIVYGTRVTLYVGLISVGIALTFGIIIGVSAGYYGGKTDSILMRGVDILLAFPGLVLAMLIAGLLGPNLTNTMIAVGIISIPTFSRVARGAVLSLLTEEYILATRALGGSNYHIIRHHILKNIFAPVLVLVTISLSTAVLAESSLSFLGLGVQPPNPSWGGMLSSGRPFMEIAPWIAIYPGLAIMIAVLGFNFLGDGLRDFLDPRLRRG
jgi:peptide/nickel transport system permease protein